MKKFLILFLIVVCCVSFCSCGKSEAVKATEKAISAIGSVTIESGNAINEAQQLYDSLSDEDKAKVKNITVLTEAISVYENAVVDNISNASIGDIVTFGSYNQERWIEEGKKPIEWVVLDNTDGKVLLMSLYVLDYLEFDSETNVWRDSAIREWLNEEFLNSAFTEKERSYIAETVLTTTITIGDDDDNNAEDIKTTDRIFILSKDDVEKYLPGEDNPYRVASATVYAFEEGVKTYDFLGDRLYRMSCNWYLRSGSTNARWGVVLHEYYIMGGQAGNHGEIFLMRDTYNYGVRPAFYFNID